MYIFYTLILALYTRNSKTLNYLTGRYSKQRAPHSTSINKILASSGGENLVSALPTPNAAAACIQHDFHRLFPNSKRDGSNLWLVPPPLACPIMCSPSVVPAT